MHRHGYKGRKLGRLRGPRQSLLRNLAIHLIEKQQLTTTKAKAKEVMPFVERLITKAKKGGLHQRRQILALTNHRSSTHKLIDEIAPQLQHRTSGHLRLQKLSTRLGDQALLAKISFVDQLKKPTPPTIKTSKTKKPTPTKTPTAQKTTPLKTKKTTPLKTAKRSTTKVKKS